MTDKSEETKVEDKVPVTKKPKKSKKDELAEAKSDADRYLNMARCLQADFDNYRKRTQKENEDFRRFATESMVCELVNVLDDLDRALASAEEGSNLVTGIKAVRNNLMKILSGRGLSVVSVDGSFDPSIHEALCTGPGEEDGKIVEVYQNGYIMNGRVLRCAKVKVTKKETEEKPEEISGEMKEGD